MKKVAIVVIVLLFIVIAIAFAAPASLLDRLIAPVTQGELRIANAEGTLWNGSGVIAVKSGEQAASITPLVWRFEPSSLLSFSARWRFGEAADALNSTLTLHANKLEIAALAMNLNAAPLIGLMPTRTVDAMSGTLALTSPNLSFDGKTLTGPLNARWDNAAIMVGDQPIQLGSINATLQAGTAMITGSGGDVTVNGSLTINAVGVPKSGLLKLVTSPTTPEQVRGRLKTLPGADKDGNVTVKF